MSHHVKDARVAVIGLGYVGLPLAVELGTRYPTLGFDISAARVAELNDHKDSTLEVEAEDFCRATHLKFSAEPADLADYNTYIVTVPTPIDENKQPNCGPLTRIELAPSTLSLPRR